MRKLLLALAIVFAVAPAAVHAQPAEALGHPLPSSDLDDGDVQVKIIAGSMAKPVNDTEVHIVVGGVDHALRTNAEGHAKLPGVAAGATVKITVKPGADAKNEISSDEFPMPDKGGVKVMLSTAPMEATPGPAPDDGAGDGGDGGDDSGGGGPMAGGGGMPEPRLMSGRGRPAQEVPGGELIATVTYDDLTAAPPAMPVPPFLYLWFVPTVGVPVTLVGYSDEHGVTATVVYTDASGRALFKGLDGSGATAYFVLTRLRRIGVVDRLMTMPPVQLPPMVGYRVMLAGEKRDAKKPAVDELAKLETPADVPAGKVLVSVAGVPQDGMIAQLYDVEAKKVVAQGHLGPEPPSHVSVETSTLTTDANAPPGALGVQLERQRQQDAVPLVGQTFTVRAAPPTVAMDLGPWAVQITSNGSAIAPGLAPPPAQEAALAQATTAKDGYAIVPNLPTGVPLIVEVRLGAETLRSTPVTLAADHGGDVALAFAWQPRGDLQAILDAPPDATSRTYLVQTTLGKNLFRSEPFQPVPDRGTAASIVVYKRVFLEAEMEASAEDELLAVRGAIAIRNFSWTPYKAADDGLIIPLPAGFKGQVAAQSNDVANVDEGFRVLRPLPPFGYQFDAGFSLPIDDGEVTVDWPLPLGTVESDLAVRLLPGVKVTPPGKKEVPGLDTNQATEGGATFFVMHHLTLIPRKLDEIRHLRFSISGLPTPPAWKVWAPRVIGLFVIVLLGVAAWIAIGAALRAGRARQGDAAARKQRIDALYEQLVAIDEQGADPSRREAVIAELERLLAADREA